MNRCRQCESILEEESPDGLCPDCSEAKSAIVSPEIPSSQRSTVKSRPRHSVPPPEELSEYFPQLQIGELLGQGGMGVVYKARQVGLDRPVALKILPREAGEQPGFAERFTREGRALAILNHPNIVTVYDSGEKDGLYYFIMEFVDGPNLRQIITAGEAKPEFALDIVAKVCEALEFAHEAGIVHRDIKPENILLDTKGRVKIADFGVAKLLDRKQTDYTLTDPHQVMGTPHYMAPEQTERPQTVDHRADIYSVGVVFYELLTGELPLGRFPLPSEKMGSDVRLDAIVLSTLAKDPDDRFQSVSELRTAVQSLSQSGLISSATTLTPTPNIPVVDPQVTPTAPATQPPPTQAQPTQPPPTQAQPTQPPSTQPPPDHMSSLHLEVDFKAAYAKVRGPANWMYCFGIISFIPMGITAVAMIIQFLFNKVELPETLTIVGMATASFLIIVGSQRMKRLESYRLCMASAILAIVPMSTVCWMPFTLFAGIWALRVLNRREIVAAFEVKRREQGELKAKGKANPS